MPFLYMLYIRRRLRIYLMYVRLIDNSVVGRFLKFLKMSLSECFPCLQFKKEEVVIKLDYSNTVLLETFPQIWQHERTLEELNLNSTRVSKFFPDALYNNMYINKFSINCIIVQTFINVGQRAMSKECGSNIEWN